MLTAHENERIVPGGPGNCNGRRWMRRKLANRPFAGVRSYLIRGCDPVSR